jgi:periplasmic mercuric ion binding protein
MRFVVYIVAVLAAAGIVYFVSGSSEKQVAVSESAAEAGTEEEKVEQTASPVVEGEVELISLKVPSMHCPCCYPSIKKTLEAEAGVAGVELAEQKEEGVIDNPVVLIKAGTNFDLEKAIATLEGTGFDGASVVE